MSTLSLEEVLADVLFCAKAEQVTNHKEIQ